MTLELGTPYHPDAIIDEVKIFNYALSEDEVKTEYNRGSAAIFGSTGTDASGNKDNSQNRKYCVPGDTATCNPPILELNFDEKQGTTAYDTSGNGNDGSIENGAEWTRGEVGSAINFDGVDDYINAGSDTSLDNIPIKTISAWIYPTIDGAGVITCKMSSGGTGFSFEMFNYGGTNSIKYWNTFSGNSGYWGVPSDSHNLNQWNYVTVIYDNSSDSNTPQIYINGEEKTVSVVSSFSPTGSASDESSYPLYIGNDLNETVQPFHGKIDEVKIYDYVRTPAQIAWEYNKGAPIAEWRFDECQGSVVHDESGNGNNGTITIGGTGTQTELGTCASSSLASAWYNGVDGAIKKSLSFDGTDDYISVGDTSLDINSISFWTKQDYTDNYFIDLDGGTNTITLSSSQIITTGFTSPTIYIDGTQKTSLPDNAWHQITVVTDTAIDTNNLSIGKIGTDYYTGLFDEIKLYNYPLTATQIKTNYSGGTVNFGTHLVQNGSALASNWTCGDTVYNDNDGITYSTVLALDGNCWLASNLGTANVATAYNDSLAYGAYYQWGRLADGHQISTSGTTATNSSGDVPGHGNFITESSSPYDWRVPQNDNLWSSAGGYINNPCPTGWHIPAQSEWATVVSAEGITNYTTAASSNLKLPAAGYRNRFTASLLSQGSLGYFWSSSPNGADAYVLYFDSSGVTPAYDGTRASGLAARCLKN